MATTAKPPKKKRVKRKFKSPKAILRNTLKYFEQKPENWAEGILHKRITAATEGVAYCALGGCRRFAENRKVGDTAIRYLAEAMGMKTAHTARIESVERYVWKRNDSANGRAKVIASLQKAIA